MFSVPLYVFLFIYFAFLAIFLAFSAMNFYHVVVTASFTMASFIASFFVFTLCVLTLYFTWYLLQDIDWQTMVVLFDRAWLENILFF